MKRIFIYDWIEEFVLWFFYSECAQCVIHRTLLLLTLHHIRICRIRRVSIEFRGWSCQRHERGMRQQVKLGILYLEYLKQTSRHSSRTRARQCHENSYFEIYNTTWNQWCPHFPILSFLSASQNTQICYFHFFISSKFQCCSDSIHNNDSTTQLTKFKKW